jgi:hypothetical protein
MEVNCPVSPVLSTVAVPHAASAVSERNTDDIVRKKKRHNIPNVRHNLPD